MIIFGDYTRHMVVASDHQPSSISCLGKSIRLARCVEPEDIRFRFVDSDNAVSQRRNKEAINGEERNHKRQARDIGHPSGYNRIYMSMQWKKENPADSTVR